MLLCKSGANPCSLQTSQDDTTKPKTQEKKAEAKPRADSNADRSKSLLGADPRRPKGPKAADEGPKKSKSNLVHLNARTGKPKAGSATSTASKTGSATSAAFKSSKSE